MADEMETRAGEIRNLTRLGIEFLNVVLAELAKTQIVGLADDARRKDFGYREERDSCWIAMGTAGGSGDSLAYRREVLGEHKLRLQYPMRDCRTVILVDTMRFLFSLVLCATSVYAQSAAGFGGISGAVRDASGSAVPNAKVVISNEAKGITRNLTTNDAGVFTAPALVPAAGYSVSVDATGFVKYGLKDLELAVGQNIDLAVALSVAGAATQVEVSAVAPLVEDTKTDVSDVIGTKQIDELPINGRRVDSFVLLTPGVSNDGHFGNLSFRGMAGNSSFLIDGVDNTEQFFNENAGRTRIASQISQDAVQEFQVVSSNFTAEYGRASAGVVNTVTRSGGNDFHGTAYWFFRNRTLNARDRYAAFNPPEYRHQAGSSISGPLK